MNRAHRIPVAAASAMALLATLLGHTGNAQAPPGTPGGGATGAPAGPAPDVLQATRRDQDTTRTRPLCQYPQVAKYNGSGSTNDAANFSCSNGF
jgi:Tannase and feruloyl esterase